MPEIIYGRHAVYHLLAAGRRRVHRLHLKRGLEKEEQGLVALARAREIPIVGTDRSDRSDRPDQGVAVETEGYPYVALETVLKSSLLLILDGIEDPQNLGALCRSAYLFGVEGVVIPTTHAASVGPGACRASVGAVEYLKIARVSSISNLLEILKKNGFWTYGADPKASRSLSEESFPEKVALVMGGEERGLRRLVRERCDHLLKIPMGGGKIGSLNTSVAGAIFLYEITRKKLGKGVEKY